MHRISVTTIEKYRRYALELSRRDNEEELIQTIRGIFEGNDYTRVGGAYHKVIEGEALVTDGGLIADDIFFTADQVRPALDFRDAHPTMIHEIPVTKIYSTDFGDIMVSGRIDGQEGLESEDKKCTFSPPSATGYMDSLQWKFYLDMVEGRRFWYDVFEVRGFGGLKGAKPYQLVDVRIIPHERISCDWYPTLPFDCLYWLNALLHYIDLRGLWPVLKQTTPSLTTNQLS